MEETVETSVVCSCCGEPHAGSEVVRLGCHPDVAVCGGCVDRMSAKVHSRPGVTPIFPVRDMTEAREFWARTGVEVELYDSGYAFVMFGGSEIAHLDLRPGLDAEHNPAACYIHVDDASAWHQRWRDAGLPVTDLVVEPWGMQEFSVRDPSGNLLRVGRNG